jgi:hypothetical protein
MAIACKWSAAEVSTENLRAFRARYREGEKLVVAQNADRSVIRSLGGVRMTVEPIARLIRRLSPK